MKWHPWMSYMWAVIGLFGAVVAGYLDYWYLGVPLAFVAGASWATGRDLALLRRISHGKKVTRTGSSG